ncbi:MAG: DUF1801 domain-containing protein [Pseudomonadota bacterium]
MAHNPRESMLTFDGAQADDPRIREWFAEHLDGPGQLAESWYREIRGCGRDVVELLHDGYPTLCVDAYPFAYVGAFSKHANVGFFYGAELPDPQRLLQGQGRRMRHVKLFPTQSMDEPALRALIACAYTDLKVRLRG